ncbi:hypothetical protein CYY_005593 [Polysphondylium violaceum]|uniref:FNIP repeat-containing protein n=1 Tax=Polysphondylium violaceum TaxID=133409 RepID=A0A8J4PUU1_9MYCE|nr:hypothetical protein CYY_005593 [Polysphondylium violaceum]
MFITEIWRNLYIRNNIRNKLLENVTIVMTVRYLNENNKYLQYIDHRYTNICVALDSLDEYSESPYRRLINIVEIHLPTTTLTKDTFGTDNSIVHLRIQSCLAIESLPDNIERLQLRYLDRDIDDSLQLPRNLLELELSNFDRDIRPNSLPSCLKTLRLSFNFNRPLLPNALPESLTLLSLGRCFKQSIGAGVLPTSLKELTMGGSPITPITNQLATAIFPPSLESFTITHDRFTTVPRVPFMVTKLLFHAFIFTKQLQVNDIPSSVVYLDLSRYTYKLYPNVIPYGVETLIASSYNLSIDVNDLPDSITSLDMQTFNQSLVNLPRKLSRLTLDSFNRPIAPNTLVEPLKYCHLPNFQHNLPPLPSSITYLNIKRADLLDLSILSNSCAKELVINDLLSPVVFNSSNGNNDFKHLTTIELVSSKYKLKAFIIPCTVKNVILLNYDFDLDVNAIPISVSSLYYSSNLNTEPTLHFPNSITNLTMHVNFPIRVGLVPSSVTCLSFMYHQYRLPMNSIPPSIRKLVFKQNLELPLEPDEIPNTVEKLVLQGWITDSLSLHSIPRTVSVLKSNSFIKDIDSIIDSKSDIILSNIFQ